jgi:radical SAM protein with 4Fe4S-binding SPASM domain
MIVDYRGEMLLCCEDITGGWDLGNVRDRTVAELWNSEKHQQILATLAEPGGREAYGFCRVCPRTGEW